jgi:hypothetical protein
VACEPWPYDLSCLPDGWADTIAGLTPAQHSAYDFAVELLGDLTMHRFGLCERVVRPCSSRCATRAGYSRGAEGWFYPYLFDGLVYNACACGPHQTCGCVDTRSAIALAGPVDSVVEVLIDGDVLAPSAYTVEGNLLIRTDGGQWPLTQDLTVASTEVDTFQVRYMQGVPLPAGGRRSLAALMVELWKARCGDSSCQLPSRVTNIVREGVTYSMLDDPTALLNAGRLGIADIDMWLASINPHNTRTRMAVYSPDLGRRGR